MKLYGDSTPVFFLGAGASKTFGYPPTKEFMSIANERKFPNPYEQLLGYLRSRRGEDQIDIETVLYELQFAADAIATLGREGTFLHYQFFESNEYSNGRLPAVREQLQKLIDSINRLVYDTYWERDEEQPDGLYRSLFECFEHPLDVFTTNYDRIVERTFWKDEKAQNPFTDGFYFDGEHTRWREELLDGQFGVRLHKLHGSVSWKKGRGERIVRVDEPFFTNHHEQVQLYPGWKGMPTKTPYKELYARLRRRLIDPKTKACVVIGFSFRDDGINEIFQEASETNKELKLLVWNPVIPKVPFDLSRCEYLRNGFDSEMVDNFSELLTNS